MAEKDLQSGLHSLRFFMTCLAYAAPLPLWGTSLSRYLPRGSEEAVLVHVSCELASVSQDVATDGSEADFGFVSYYPDPPVFSTFSAEDPAGTGILCCPRCGSTVQVGKVQLRRCR